MTKFFRRFAKWVDDHLLSLLLGSIAAVMIAVVVWPYSVIDIPPGRLGVRWSRFGGGTVMDEVYQEGIRFIPPWDKMYLYDVRLQRMHRTYNVLAKDSLSVRVTVDFMYRPNELLLPYIHRYVGPDYAETVLAPVVGFETRNSFANFSADTGLTADRSNVAVKIEAQANKYLLDRFNPPSSDGNPQLQLRYMIIEGVLINDITLPTAVADAIAAKNAAREQVETYAYLVQTEQKEAERKAIEAKGIKQFTDNVGDGLTDSYLRLKAIELTRELIKSPNGKVIVLGGGSGSLPLVLGADGTPAVAPAPAPPGSASAPATPTPVPGEPPPASGPTPAPTAIPAPVNRPAAAPK